MLHTAASLPLPTRVAYGAMRVGLVGLPTSGKTTVFGAMTGQKGAYGKANMGVVKVPDTRVDRLSEICQPKKTTYANTAEW